MKVSIFCPYAINTPHYETELEIAQRHLDKGDQVTFLFCMADLRSCDVNLAHSPINCLECVGRFHAGRKLLNGKVNYVPLRKFITTSRKVRIDFKQASDLCSYSIENFDIGWAVLSSLISFERDPNVDLIKLAPYVHNLLRSSANTYDAILNYLDNNEVDRMYIFNGRYAPLRAAFRACQAANVDCWTHERGCDYTHFSLYDNTLPHDLKFHADAMFRDWNEAQSPYRDDVAHQWYLKRIHGVNQGWFSFTSLQKDGLLPENWDPANHNVVIFSSSEDEFISLGEEWLGPIYNSQIEGMVSILPNLSHTKSRIYLRVHPNLIGIDNHQLRTMMSLKAPHLTVIPPDSNISSYALMNAANTVVSFGSTAGIEAAYWGKPSILAGRALYSGLGSVYEPTKQDELIELMERRDLPALPKIGAAIYGFYTATFGEPFQYFEGTDVFEGHFKGQVVRPLPLYHSAAQALRGAAYTRRVARSWLNTITKSND